MAERARRARLAGVLTTGVVVAALAAAYTWGDPGAARGSDSSSTPDAGRGGRSAEPVVQARRAGAPRAEVPVRSVLPNGAVVAIRPVGTRPDGRLAIPDDLRVAGWWRGGARLGDPFGSTLLAAHVDSATQGLGPYASLLSVGRGQHVVLSSAHLTQTFRVVSLSLVPRESLGKHPRIFSASGPRRLTLVTCAGPYDASRGGYQNLAVVTALPVRDVVRRRSR